jgi:hypothetical protein
MKAFLLTVVALVVAMLGQSEASAQYAQNQLSAWKNRNTAAGFTSDHIRNSVINRAIPQYGFSNVNRGLLSGAKSRPPGQKPFSNLVRQPSVSPYLGLLANNPFTSTTDNYFNIVRPQLEQQRINKQLAERNMQLQRQLNDIAAQGAYTPTGDVERAPTGHVAVYMNYGGYYTPPQTSGGRGGRR